MIYTITVCSAYIASAIAPALQGPFRVTLIQAGERTHMYSVMFMALAI